MLVILVLTRRIADAPAEKRPQLDVVGAVLSALGLGLLVFGVLRSGEWGWIQPKAGGPSWAGLSPTVWLILAGLFVIWLFFRWQARRESQGEEPLVRPAMLRNRQLTGGLTMFFFQYLVQAGLFFVVPLYLSVCARPLGARDRRAAAAALDHAAGRRDRHPALPPERLTAPGRPLRPARAARRARSSCSAALDPDAGPEIVFVPMLLIGLGIGALASQLGAVTVSAVPDDAEPRGRRRPEHDDEPRRLARHGARRLAPDRGADDGVPDEHPAEPGDPGRGEVSRRRSSSRAASRSSPTPTSRRRSTRRGVDPATPRRRSTPTRDARLDGLRVGARDPRRARARRAVLRAAHPDQATGGSSGLELGPGPVGRVSSKQSG